MLNFGCVPIKVANVPVHRHVSMLRLVDTYRYVFDTINHNILLSLLHYYGFSKGSINFLKSYLEDRIQYVRLPNSISTFKNISRGVPQGSILGPLLFIIYTSVFPKVVKYSSIHMYADDIQIYYSFNLDERDMATRCINSDLQSLADVSLKHELVLNPTKSSTILFGSSSQLEKLHQFDVMINNTTISQVNEVKNLGLVMDNTMRYQNQVKSYIKKAYANLKLIYPHRFFMTRVVKTLLCEALVLSHFSYCSSVYNACLTQDMSNQVQRAQNSCLRLIYGIRKYEHISHKLAEIKWLNMRNRRLLQCLTLYHQVILEKTPAYLYNKIRYRSDVHNINIRYKSTITPPAHKTTLFERSFSYQVSKLYNSLPCHLKLSNKSKFKYLVKLHIFENQIVMKA
jgi:hypothetical protein